MSFTSQQQNAVRQSRQWRDVKRKVVGVYDSAYYGYDLHIPLDDPRLTSVTTFTYSTGITEKQFNLEEFDRVAGTPANFGVLMHSYDQFFATNDTVPIMHLGNDTPLSADYLIEADMTAQLHQVQLIAAFALNCSAYDTGSPTINGVKVTAQSYQNGGQPISPILGDDLIEPATAFTPLAATGTLVYFVRAFLDFDMKMVNHQPLIIELDLDVTFGTGTTVCQAGILPAFSYISNNIQKKWITSQAIAHIHPTPDHIMEVVKNTQVDIEGMSPKADVADR